ncbi:DUF411 domain-containing protein [Pseudomaricurvus alkylphenolicus]|uniref:DUF411 domain-containing protein n=1 Tax=Pseudomaricurvus alkylphenolicus TaxID=1306991 RepID=UPI0014227F2C|nr:DUF411 domain-containing protein [Pseudomaricurvus alkylphenolicus]NIB39744.1 DUF411 domain-containing protein [Pseudomaricurvus alkylphenolicus]
MKWVVRSIGWIVATTLLLSSVVAYSDKASLTTVSSSVSDEAISLDVYKSRTCGCCKKWVSHIEEFGFESEVHHPTNLNEIKSDKGIAPRYQSCHTAVTNDGYVFEGHIPGSVIQRFLAAPPEDAIGLAVPGMPVGSPGMEVGDRFDPYDVLLLKKDGSSEVYQHISGLSAGK